MNSDKKAARYQRVYKQLCELLVKCDNPNSRIATIAAVLHHKMDNFFWTGFYLLMDNKLLVGPYQGPVACMDLKKDQGVCWAGINNKQTICVADVEKFPGHISCDTRSRSEIVVPLWNNKKEIIGVLDIDSKELNNFDIIDTENLERILNLVFKTL